MSRTIVWASLEYLKCVLVLKYLDHGYFLGLKAIYYKSAPPWLCEAEAGTVDGTCMAKRQMLVGILVSFTGRSQFSRGRRRL